MYKSFFGLARKPFSMTPDPAFLFLTRQHREALAGLTYAILDRKGFLSLSGMAGTGKTTLVASVLKNLPKDQVQSSVILNPMLSPEEFLEMAMMDFGIPDIPQSKPRRLQALQSFLTACNNQGQICTLIIDEAHKLSSPLLEEIRLLGNFEQDDRKLLQVLLIGQSELDEVLSRPELWQLKQRISVRLSIEPLSAAEIDDYIKHRWRKAGGQDPHPFSPAAVVRIAALSQGIPRLVNSICDNALMLAFADAVRTVEVDQIASVAKDLRLHAEAAPVLPAVPKPSAVPPPAGANAAAVPAVSSAAAASAAAGVPAPVAAPVPSPAQNPAIRIKALERYTPEPRKTSFFTRLAQRLGLVSRTARDTVR